MALKKKMVIAAVAVGAAAGLGVASPALADVNCNSTHCQAEYTEDLDFDTSVTYTAQVDNRPGSGAASWVWVGTTGRGDHVDYYLNGNSTMQKMWAPFGGSNATQPNQNVTKFRVCGPNRFGSGDVCSGWHFVNQG